MYNKLLKIAHKNHRSFEVEIIDFMHKLDDNKYVSNISSIYVNSKNYHKNIKSLRGHNKNIATTSKWIKKQNQLVDALELSEAKLVASVIKVHEFHITLLKLLWIAQSDSCEEYSCAPASIPQLITEIEFFDYQDKHTLKTFNTLRNMLIHTSLEAFGVEIDNDALADISDLCDNLVEINSMMAKRKAKEVSEAIGKMIDKEKAIKKIAKREEIEDLKESA